MRSLPGMVVAHSELWASELGPEIYVRLIRTQYILRPKTVQDNSMKGREADIWIRLRGSRSDGKAQDKRFHQRTGEDNVLRTEITYITSIHISMIKVACQTLSPLLCVDRIRKFWFSRGHREEPSWLWVEAVWQKRRSQSQPACMAQCLYDLPRHFTASKPKIRSEARIFGILSMCTLWEAQIWLQQKQEWMSCLPFMKFKITTLQN